MAITEEEALALKDGDQVAMGKTVYTVRGHEKVHAWKEPVLWNDKGERISSVLYVLHILHHYTPPPKKVEEKAEGESQESEASSTDSDAKS